MTISLDDFETLWGALELALREHGNARLIALIDHASTREQLRALLRNKVNAARGRTTSGPGALDPLQGLMPPELWTKRRREKANIAAMNLIADFGASHKYTSAQRAVLATYSGWGGLSIRDNKSEFPQGLVPETRGLIHEYYTPSKVVNEVARVLRPVMKTLPRYQGRLRTLEPSAGIGRFVQAFADAKEIDWTIIEYSHISAMLLQSLRQDLTVYEGPFEQWVTENHQDYDQTFGLVLSNPPYGERGDSTVLDPVRLYRQRQAYEYFLLRSLDMLAPGGMGVFLVPGGFLTKVSSKLRERVLKSHHLSTAYRLPSKLFPGAMLVIDLLFFRARGETLDKVLPADRDIVNGKYFDQFPEHILGEEVGKDGGDDNQGPTAKPRWGYQVKGVFERLPDLRERAYEIKVAPAQASGRKIKGGGRVDRDVGEAARVATSTQAAASALSLGVRVDHYLRAVAQNKAEGMGGWNELHDDLVSWVRAHKNPSRNRELQKLFRANNDAATRFLAAFKSDGTLVDALLSPRQASETYKGRPGNLGDILHWAYRYEDGGIRLCNLTRLVVKAGKHSGLRAAQLVSTQLPDLIATGRWCIAGEAFDLIVAAADYYSGNLWPKYDRVNSAAKNPERSKVIRDGKLHDLVPATVLGSQARKLLEMIAPVVGEDVTENITPQQAWLPVEIVSEWASQHGYVKRKVQFRWDKKDGLLYASGPGADIWDPFLGWANHYDAQFKVSKSRETPLMVARDRVRKEWTQSFRSWLAVNPKAVDKVAESYNRKFRGYVAPTFGHEPIQIARWTGPIKLRPHQTEGARRILHNRRGLLAFDVGVGKTFAGISIMAKAREEGWARRPVILVPNTLVMNWRNQIKVALPDYRVGVIGSDEVTKKKKDKYGNPIIVTRKDTPEKRAEKWQRFQAGDFDCMILPYSMLNRTRLNREALETYAAQSTAIQREIEIAKRKKKKSERDLAIIEEQGLRWIAEKAEVPERMRYDPGIAWDDLGVDMLIVDEAQNFKNLYMAESRDGSTPKFMGAGSSSKRAWQMDFRCASVRALTGGSGVVLLSATPAKNSPLEFYNLIQFVHGDAWKEVGIPNPEQFIDRYLRIEQKRELGADLKFKVVPAVTGFQNIPELRSVLFRYAEFKTAEEVGIPMPVVTANLLHIRMDSRQDRLYEALVKEYRSLSGGGRFDKEAAARRLQIMSELSLVALHPELPGNNWKTADTVENPNAPKFRELARRVMHQMDCGHVVFVENTAVHVWLRDVLVKAGVPKDRIAIMNAITAPVSKRQKMADGFNGAPTGNYTSEGDPIRKEPIYDVVIANSVAYEGIDLQVRTCAIHHLDLPWEPATLQQRNGRGVRQGNKLGKIEINYYMSRRSMDGRRFAAINGKHGWMKALLTSQDRDTNNPGAQAELSEEDIALMISRNPATERAELRKVRRRRTVDARLKAAADAGSILRSIKGRLVAAKRARTHERAEQMRAEAKVRGQDLALVDPVAWPYLEWADKAVEAGAQISREGIPLIGGSFLKIDGTTYEIGSSQAFTFGVRDVGQAVWTKTTLSKLSKQIRDAGIAMVTILDAQEPEVSADEDVDDGPEVIVKTGRDTSEGSDQVDDADRPAEVPNFMPELFTRLGVPDVRPKKGTYRGFENSQYMSDSWLTEVFDLDPLGYLNQLPKPNRTDPVRYIPYFVEGRLIIGEYKYATVEWRRRQRNFITPSLRGLKAFKAAFLKSSPKRVNRGHATAAMRHWWQNEALTLSSGRGENPEDNVPVVEPKPDVRTLQSAIDALGHQANTGISSLLRLLPPDIQEQFEATDLEGAIKAMPGWDVTRSYSGRVMVTSPHKAPTKTAPPWTPPEPPATVTGSTATREAKHWQGTPKKLRRPVDNNKWGVAISSTTPVQVGDTVRVTARSGKQWTSTISGIENYGPNWVVRTAPRSSTSTTYTRTANTCRARGCNNSSTMRTAYGEPMNGFCGSCAYDEL